MNTAEQVIAIILASALAFFLILAIIAAVMVIRVLKDVQDMAMRASRLMEVAAETVNSFKQSAPLTILRVIGNMAESFSKRKASNKE